MTSEQNFWSASQRAARAAEALLADPHPSGVRGEVAAHYAARFGVNRFYVYTAIGVLRADPALHGRVLRGEVTLQNAVRDLRDRNSSRVPGSSEKSYATDRAEPREMLLPRSSWRNVLAAAMADQGHFERSLESGLLLRLQEKSP